MKYLDFILDSILELHNHYCDLQAPFEFLSDEWFIYEERKAALKQLLLNINAFTMEELIDIGFGRIEVRR